MIFKKQLKIISVISHLILVLLALYFKLFFTIINSQVSNISIFCLIFIFISLLVYGSFILTESIDLYLLLPQSLMFTFLVRAIPNLRLSYPPLHDPYFHFVCSLNVIEYGTLKPILGWWYSDINSQLHWPNMHIITTDLVKITNVNVMQFFRFQEPFMGIVFFLIVFSLTKIITSNYSVAMLAGLFASINDVVIFYQSEYHPQGVAFIYLLMLVYAFIKSRQLGDIRYRYVSLIFAFVFIFSHYFTPLFLAIMFCSYVAVTFMLKIFACSNRIQSTYGDLFGNLKSDYIYFILVIVTSLSYHIFVYFRPLEEFIRLMYTPITPGGQGQLISVSQNSVPLLSSILSSSKWGLFLLAIVSILLIAKTKNENEFRLSIIVVSILCAGSVGNYIIFLPLDRIIALYTPFAAIFASLTLNRFLSQWFRNVSKNGKLMLIILIASMIMTCGLFNSQFPAFFFKDSKIDTYYWYSNRLPSMDEYKSCGEWIGNYSIENSKYGTEFDTRMIPFFYGKKSDSSTVYIYSDSLNYTIVNPTIPYRIKFSTSNMSTIYTNKELEIYVF